MDGTPALSMMNTRYMPGGARAALAGAVTRRFGPERLNFSSRKRCSILKLWVTEPVLMRVTRRIAQARFTPRVNSWPILRLHGAAMILGLTANAPAAVYRYGG